ncbi:MAG: IS4 family transposase, partial [Gammaproteobacteria bacterium]|nr:IS4 family transposase [Gammaproteobacteria bacterium]
MKDTVFQQILKPLTQELMQECVRRFRSDYDCEKFLTWHHLQTMVYAHLNEIKSLSTLEVAINSQQIGITCEVKRSTLSDANQRRPAGCFFWILQQLMNFLPRKWRRNINKVVKILDSSPIQLKGRGYNEWAKEFATTRCQGLKLHVEYDLEIESPTKVAMSYPNFNDCSMGNQWPIISNAVYVYDKGYYDYNWWWTIHQNQAFFVTRLKKNAAIVMQENKENISATILEEGIFEFKNKNPRGGKINLYQDRLRRISVYREGKTPLILVTNLFDVSAEIIAELYKARWEVELFFKWIKQNLRLKKFLGKSENAVKIQIATAIIAYVLAQLYKDNSGDNRRLQLVLVWIRCSLCVVAPKFKNYIPPIYR